MIQVNLLPPEYRQRDGTNMPLLLAAALGVAMVLGMIFWWFTLSQEVTQLESTLVARQAEEAKLQEEAKKVKAIQDEINELRTRQETIIDISQSKVMWSLKLEQLSELMSKYKDFWVDSIRLLPGASQRLSMSCSALDYDLQRVASFRRALKEDPNFAYHFDGLKSDRASREEIEGYVNAKEKASFEVSLPLASTRIAKKGR
ncbi:MAG: hypothetical protein KDD82_25800 [Planctomycetes bacterium]|nr:hypothetical protein [Planctomycetota bacterium]